MESVDLWTLGKNPVSADQPAGTDIRYDPDFEALQAELGKLSSPSAAGAVDWEKVIQMASGLLANKSKDIWVASALAVALIYTRQAEGLAIGMRVCRDLVTNFWDNLYPPKKRIRGRLQTIAWWLEKTESALASVEKPFLPAKQITEMKEDFEALDKVLAEYPNEAPSTASIRQFLKAITLKPEPEPGPQPETEPQAEPQPPSEEEAKAVEERVTSREEAEGVEEITSTRQAQQELNASPQKIRRVAAYLREEDASNPLPYRLNRIAAWFQVKELPPLTDGRTRLPPPDGQVQTVLSGFRENGDWENLLKAAEPRLPRFVFWLDLNHDVARALGHLGAQYEPARKTVCEETAFLVYRLPGLENLSFSDGTPFANSETRGWVREIAIGGENSGEGLPASLTTSATLQEDDLTRSGKQRAQRLVKGGKFFEAVDLLQKQLHNTSSRKERLLWRLALSQLLIQSKNTRLVLPHLEEIFRDVDHYRLEEWDPALALSALKVVWTGLNTQREQTTKERGTEVLNRIAKLDLNEAARLERGS